MPVFRRKQRIQSRIVMNASSITTDRQPSIDPRVNRSDKANGEPRRSSRDLIDSKRDDLVQTDPAIDSDTMQCSLTSVYAPIVNQLREVEQRLSQELNSSYPDLASVLQHGTQLGGKRLRPAMLLLIGKAIGSLGQNHLTTATVIEMVHTATLIHDDVLDAAVSRRHVPTVNAKWNNHTSILLGDYLFSQAYRLAATTSSTIACEKVGEAARKVCEGELRQVLHRDVTSLTEDEYISMVQAKTGELCRVACELGAVFSQGSDNEIRAASRFGNSLGIAFQIADDFLDIWGDDEVVGKTLGTDLQQGKITLPIIRLLSTAKASESQEILEILSGPPEHRGERMMPILEASDAKSYTHDVAREFYLDALSALQVFRDGDAKKSLESMAEFSVNRRF